MSWLAVASNPGGTEKALFIASKIGGRIRQIDWSDARLGWLKMEKPQGTASFWWLKMEKPRGPDSFIGVGFCEVPFWGCGQFLGLVSPWESSRGSPILTTSSHPEGNLQSGRMSLSFGKGRCGLSWNLAMGKNQWCTYPKMGSQNGFEPWPPPVGVCVGVRKADRLKLESRSRCANRGPARKIRRLTRRRRLLRTPRRPMW